MVEKARGYPAELILRLLSHLFTFGAMYTRQEASRIRQEFWTAFGQYMLPIRSAENNKTAWLNYKTGEKGLYFRMNADNKKASIGIELTHTDPGIQQLYFEQFKELKHLLNSALSEEWTWALHTTDEYGKTISRIYTELSGVNIFKKEDWPRLISFFKPRIMALDDFWSSAKYGFEALR
jgi:hypothetical protein